MLRKPCDCCKQIETADGCDHCCEADTLPTELQLTIPAGWSDQTECDQCDAMAGDWFVPLDSFLAPGANCSFFGSPCATWKLNQSDWCEMDCDNGLGQVFYRFEILVQLWCNRPSLDECRLEAIVGVGRDAADDDPCPREAKQKYQVDFPTPSADCRFANLVLSKTGALIGDPDVCDTPPAAMTVNA